MNINLSLNISKQGLVLLNRGNELLDGGDYLGALDAYTRMVNVENDVNARAFAYLQRGLAYRYLEEINQAIRDWTEVINLTSVTDLIVIAYSNRSKILDETGNVDAALSDVYKIIELVPNYAEAYNLSSQLKSKKGDTQGAIADISKAIKLEPNNHIYYLNRGIILYKQTNDLLNALADYDQAIRIQPNDADNFFYRALTLGRLNRTEEANRDINTAIRLNPHDCSHYGIRGEIRLSQGDLSGAIDDFEYAIQLNADYGERYKLQLSNALAKRSLAFMEKYEFEKALEDAEKAIFFQPSHYLGYYARANVYHYDDMRYLSPPQMTSQAHSAITNYTNVIQIKPDFPDAYASRAMLWMKYGELERAFEDMKIALRLSPHQQQWVMSMQIIVNSLANDGYRSVAKLGVLFMEIDWDDYLQSRHEGTANYDPLNGIVLPPDRIIRPSYSEQDTVKITPINNTEEEVKELLERGVQQKRAKDFDSAREAYEAAIQLKPDSTLAYYGLAKICYLTNKPRDAISNYLKALHISVNTTGQAAERTDANPHFQIFLSQLPENIHKEMDRIHPFAKWLLLDPNTPRHLAHVIIDLNSKFPKSEALKKYRGKYRTMLLGNADLNLDDNLENKYLTVGIQFAIDNINWNRITDLSQIEYYNESSKLKFSALGLFNT